MKVKNQNGAEFDISKIYDAWHLARYLKENGMENEGEKLIELWHQANAMRDVLCEHGKAEITGTDRTVFL